MIGNTLHDRLTELDQDIKDALINAISSHGVESKHISRVKCLKVNVFDYVELLVWNDDLTFLDKNGLHYSLFNGDIEYEDLIDIIIEYEDV